MDFQDHGQLVKLRNLEGLSYFVQIPRTGFIPLINWWLVC